MTKIAKQKDALTQLHSLVLNQGKEKTAGAPKPEATGTPGADTDFTSVDAKHETTDQNNVGPENNDPQTHKQEMQTDSSTPTNSEVKSAGVSSEFEALSRDLLTSIKKATEAKPEATGTPGADTDFTSVDEKHETTDQNNVGPENNDPQTHKQEMQTDPSTPTNSEVKTAEEAIRAYQYGRVWAESVFKEAAALEFQQYKEAGRRDFEEIVQSVSEQLKSANVRQPQASTQEKSASYQDPQEAQVKQAELEGYNAFHGLVKQKKAEEALMKYVSAHTELKQKVASLEKAAADREKELRTALQQKEAELARFREDEQEQQKQAHLIRAVTSNVVETLKREFMPVQR